MLCYGKELFTGLEVIYMTPKEILCQWVDAFNNADVEIISELYDDNAINHQVANEPVIGKEAIKKMFEQDFSIPEMVCIVENIFEDGQWTMDNFRVACPIRFKRLRFFSNSK